MAINIVEEVQTRLQFPPLEKIDPNTQSKEEAAEVLHYPVTQAAVITALAGLYKITRTTEGCENLFHDKTGNWLEEVYGENLTTTIDRVAEYSGAERKEVEKLIKLSADVSVIILQEQFANNVIIDAVMSFMSGQRDNILVFLPGPLQLGEMLHDDTLDDNTNKMEGPVSSLMHKIENIFSEGE
jgi:vacuolar-type H+-ATPase subunit F/Vma7